METKIARTTKEGYVAITINAEKVMATIRDHGYVLCTDQMKHLNRVDVHPEVLKLISQHISSMTRYSAGEKPFSEVAKLRESWGEYELNANPRLVPEKIIVYAEDYCEMLNVGDLGETAPRGVEYHAAYIDEVVPGSMDKKEDDFDFIEELEKL